MPPLAQQGMLLLLATPKTILRSSRRLLLVSLASYGVTEKDIIQVAYGYGSLLEDLGFTYGSEKLGALTVSNLWGEYPSATYAN
jgi:phenylacetate-coenzyme A ligase PaaK-like adenylate-forming protein